MNKWKQWPLVSALLVAANLLIFIIGHFGGAEIYLRGVLDAESVVIQKEYGRILYAMFLHGDFGHLANNMFILFFLGAMIEKETGHIWFFVLYLVSGVGGNLLSLAQKLLTGEAAVSLGASGAVFGLDGALLAMVLFLGWRISSVTPARVLLLIVCSLYSGFVGYHIDNAAHVGGLVVGFAVGVLMCFIKRRRMIKRWKIER